MAAEGRQVAAEAAGKIEQPFGAGQLRADGQKRQRFVKGQRPARLSRAWTSSVSALPIGDRLETDIRMGNESGMKTALVLTGVTDAKMLEASPVRPDHIFPSGDPDYPWEVYVWCPVHRAPYRPAISPDKARSIIAEQRSTTFDPDIIDLFLIIYNSRAAWSGCATPAQLQAFDILRYPLLIFRRYFHEPIPDFILHYLIYRLIFYPGYLRHGLNRFGLCRDIQFQY
jgi:hypothetical protein